MIPILSGVQEQHISADIAYACGNTGAPPATEASCSTREPRSCWKRADSGPAVQSGRETATGLQGPDLCVESGKAAEAILAAEDEPAVAIVMMTPHGDSSALGRRLGRVAEAVIVGSKKPLIISRPGISHPEREIRRLLLPLDGTPTTAMALQPVTALARRFGASIDLLYVAGAGRSRPKERGSIGVSRYVDQQQHEWPNWAAEVGARFAQICAHCPAEVFVQLYLARGDVATEIARFATEHACDAIALVRRSRLQAGRGGSYAL